MSADSKRKATYHGVKLATIHGKSRFSNAELKRAVELAVAKNRHLFVPYEEVQQEEVQQPSSDKKN